MKWKKTTKKKLVLIGISAYLFGIMGMPLVLADTGLPVDVGDSLIYNYTDSHTSKIEERDASTSIRSGTVNLTLGNDPFNVVPPTGYPAPGVVWPEWENWNINVSDPHYESDSELSPGNTTSDVTYGFLDIFSMNYPCTEIIDDDMRFPVVLNDTNWANFQEDAEKFIQDYDAAYESSTITSKSDTDSITIERSRVTDDYEDKYYYHIEYSDDGICEEYTRSRTLKWLINYQSEETIEYTVIRIPRSGITGYNFGWFGIMFLGSIIGVVGWHRSRYR